jgi:hypothetical protein
METLLGKPEKVRNLSLPRIHKSMLLPNNKNQQLFLNLEKNGKTK